MEDVEFSAEFCRFIQTTIPDVDAAELLLLFHARQGEALTAEEAATNLGSRARPADLRAYLDSFTSYGLLSGVERRYQYRPESPLAHLVESLAQAYSQRPVTLVRIIYALRDSQVRSFADAFRLRRK